MTITYIILPCHRSQCYDKVSVFYLFWKLTYIIFPFNGSIISYLMHILYHDLTSLIVRLLNLDCIQLSNIKQQYEEN